MIGPRIGVRIGPRIGLAVGVGADTISPGDLAAAGVTRDATRLVYLPASATEWATTLTAANDTKGGPTSIWRMQQTSGDAIDELGNFNLTATGTLLYQQIVSDMATKGISTVQGIAGVLASTAAGLPDISTTSCSLLMYVAMPAIVATTRAIGQLGQPFAFTASAQLVPTKKLRFALDPNIATGADDLTTVTRPIWITVDRTNGVASLDSDLETLTAPLTSTPSSREVMIGGDNLVSWLPDTFTYPYAVLFVGAAAERTTAQRRTLLTTLGWSPLW